MASEIPHRIKKVLTITTLVLVFLGFAYQCIDHLWHKDEIIISNSLSLFNLNEENNIPAFYSALLLLSAAGLLGQIAYLERRSRYRLHWVGLSALFAYLSYDEAFVVHENLKQARIFLTAEHFLYDDAWIFIGFAFVAIVGLLYSRFILKLPQQIRTLFLVSGGIYVSGALGMEVIGGYWQFLHGKDFIHALFATIEESLEMMGVVLFIYALLQLIDLHPKSAKHDR
ncbi:MAG: hypothetical protein Kow00121_53270 [Elainellaceae cyanobacterium]